MILIVTKSGREYKLITDEMTFKEIIKQTDEFRKFLNEVDGFITISSSVEGFERKIILAVDSIESWEFVNE